ncbi:hypothetical protein R2362_03110 [Mycobacteroides chelonae]|nr:hypothetical protein [Mycobacteroides chelonae]
MTASIDRLLGNQAPRLKNYPEWDDDALADRGLIFIEKIGIDLLPWQQDFLHRSLRKKNGRWSASQVGLVIPRQSGKTVVLEARELIGLFILNERIFHTSQQAKTSTESWNAMCGYIAEVPELKAMLFGRPKHGGEEVSVKLKSKTNPDVEGAFIRYIARSPNSGRGFREIDLVMCDEAYALSEVENMAFGPAQSSAPNPQKWLTSSAGTDDSLILSAMREAGISDPCPNPKLLYGEWSLPEGSDPTDRSLWPIAKPSLGMPYCNVETLEDQFHDMTMTGKLAPFAREHMGMWNDPMMNSVIDLKAWQERTEWDVDGRAPEIPVDWTVACLDVAPDRSSWSAVIAGMRPDGRHHVEVVSNESGSTKGILPLFQRLRASSSPPKAVAVQAGGRAGDFGPELEQIGFKVTYFGSKEIANSTGQFEDDIVGGKLSHLDDPFLFDGLAGATKYQIGGDEEKSGGWGWLRKNSAVDITGIVACSYANRLLTLESVEQTLTKKAPGRLLISGDY